ncbi:MAG: DUF2235 domain-containing protein [Marinagarivorans sp.]|nr:DUF2235 domain-containing protein [Marinagarivorans sp.]
MTELIEGYCPPTLEKKPEDPKDKKPLTIRIILMCDGTNNNQANIAERDKFEVGKEKESASHKEFGTIGSSYDNGRTNIATMEPHVESGEGVGGYSFVAKVYVQGQGTFNFKKDSNFFGKGMGALSSGVYQRAREGINDALTLVQEKLLDKKKPEKYFIKQVDVDVFGFSRGAATARHAIHVVTTEETIVVANPSGYGAQTVVTNQPLFDRLRTTYGYSEMCKDHVKVIFAGLYDTVVSVNASQLMPAWIANNTRSQQAVAKAKFALHLAAADEHRQDFPLHRITSATKSGTGAEYFLPGVHSDIGGSYNLANEELLVDGEEKKDARIRELKGEGNYFKLAAQKEELEALGYEAVLEETAYMYTQYGQRISTLGRLYTYRQISGLEYTRPSDEVDRVINRGRVSALKEDMEQLKADGWYKSGQIVIDVDYFATTVRTAASVLKAVIDPFGAYEDGSPKSGRLIVNRKNIHSGYCTLPLKFMVEHSRKQAILINPKLDRRISIILDTWPGFKSLEAALRKYMTAKGLTGSKPSDWNNINEAKGWYAGIRTLRNKQLHMSSAFTIPVMDPGFTPRFEGNRRRRFYYEG